MSRKISINDDQLKVFETVPDLYLILSPKLQILTASDAYLEATFTVREEIVGKFIFDAFPDNPNTPLTKAVSNVNASLQEVLATGKPHKMALQRYDVPKPETKGGFEKKYWQPIHTPVLDDQKNVLYIIQKVIDVTRQVEDNARIETLQEQQRHDREQLGYQHSLLRMLFDQAPVGICLSLGMDMVIASANPVVCEMWGYTAEQVLDKPLLDAVPELRGQGFDTLLQNVLQSGIPYYGKEQAAQLLTNGKLETRYFNFTYMALKDENEAVIGVLTVAVEVTEQVLARQQLEQSYKKEQSLNEELEALNEELRTTNEELIGAKKALEKLNNELEERVQERTKELNRFKFMADQARDAFILMREDGSFAYLNKKALETWGYTEEEALHLRVTDIDTVYDQEVYSQVFAEVQKEVIPQLETKHKTKEGHILPVEVNAVGLTIGETPYLFAIARDITQRKKDEEEMKVSNAELKRTNNDLDNFIYTASHDLKAPIFNIEGLLHVLLRTLPPESLASDRVQRITSMMQESVDRFKKTIANLTEVGKLQKENSKEAVMVDLSEVIEDVQSDLEQIIKSSGAEIEVNVADCPVIYFSEKNLRSVVYNLLSNAIKYRAPDRVPRVQISCKTTSDHHVLSVKDNGLGMAPRHVSQLFTMFKRFHSHVEGTGIGLYMIKKMVENAGGRIEVKSQLGEGTTFHVYFKS